MVDNLFGQLRVAPRRIVKLPRPRCAALHRPRARAHTLERHNHHMHIPVYTRVLLMV